MYNLIWLLKISLSQPEGSKTKHRQGSQNTLCVIRIRFDQKIQISGKSWHAVKSQRISTDNHELSVVGV